MIKFYRPLLGLAMMASLGSIAVAGENAWESIHPGGETSCANGEDYVFHVRQGRKDRLMIYLNGGGACWTPHMCDPANSSNDMNKGMIYRTQPTDEYGNDPRSMAGAYDFNNKENPFADWSHLFVVYCTGDVHLGGMDRSYTRKDGTSLLIRHRGKANALAAMDYAATNFSRAETVFVSGGSAGAIASHYYAAEAAERFPKARITHFAGGGGGYRPPPAQTELWEQWGTFTSMPEWWDSSRFDASNTRLGDLIYPAAEAFPDIRFHRYDTAYDHAQELFQQFMGYPTLLYYNVTENNRELSADLPYYRSYVGTGEFHTILRFDDLYQREVNGVRAVDWIRDAANGKDVPDISCGSSAQCR